MSTPRVIVLLSGGLDSTTALALAAAEAQPVRAVSIDYGQRLDVELDAARRVAAHYDVPHTILDMKDWGRQLVGCAFTQHDMTIADGTYDDYAAAGDTSTVVPNRNATMLMAAAGIAEATGADEVWAAVHTDDNNTYPDTRPEFFTAIARACELGTGGKVTIRAPFGDTSKAGIAALGARLGAPLHLTWSCYKGGDVHCGTCPTCIDRRAAFVTAGVADPTRYAAEQGGAA